MIRVPQCPEIVILQRYSPPCHIQRKPQKEEVPPFVTPERVQERFPSAVLHRINDVRLRDQAACEPHLCQTLLDEIVESRRVYFGAQKCQHHFVFSRWAAFDHLSLAHMI
jgi:hypothetical protein